MKSTGIVRKVDELGRIVIPMELRRTLGIGQKDALEIFVQDDQIILKKYQADMACAITGEVAADNIRLANGKLVLSQEAAKQIINELENSVKEAAATKE